MTSKESKVAIVTGGVSGIGAELTRTLVRRGWRVAALDLKVQANLAATLSTELGASSFEFMTCDVSSYEELADCFAKAFANWGRVDAFLSNAGLIDRSSIYIFANRGSTDVPSAPDTACTDICFKALIYGTQLSIHYMRRNPIPGGFIVATSSCVALYPIPSFPEYSAAKAAINAFARASAPILKQRENITINTVCPGTVPTRSISQDMRDAWGHDILTPASTVVDGYFKFLDDPSLTGEVVEASRDKVLLVPPTPYTDGDVSRRASAVYDPFFKAVHGEPSGLKDAVHPKG